MNTNSPAAYSILNPNKMLTRYTAEGHISILVHAPNDRGYLTVADMSSLAAQGAIIVHSIGGNTLAENYGRVAVAYTVV